MKELKNHFVVIEEQQLPLSCPMQGSEVWNLHPRVYLPIEETGAEACPYCGTEYVLKNFSSAKKEAQSADDCGS